MELRKTELDSIDNYIENLGIKEFDLRLELKDHIASIVEYKEENQVERVLDMTYVEYEITNLVREIKAEIKQRGLNLLYTIFNKNIFSPNIFIIFFFASICNSLLGFGHGRGVWLIAFYFLITPIALFFHQKFVSKRLSGSSLKIKSMIKNSWMPLIIIGGISMLVHQGSIIFYGRFFGWYGIGIIGKILSSLCFGMYVKILFDTFYTIPEMIKEEQNLLEFTRTFKIT